MTAREAGTATAREVIDAATTHHQMQTALIEWRDWRQAILPELHLLFAVANGDLRDPIVAARLKDEGVMPGIPDLLLLVSSRGFHGLAIELKTKRDRLSDVQRDVIDRLDAAGYSTWVARSWPDAAQRILWYLGADSKLAPER